MITLTENLLYNPFRSGRIDISVAKTTFEGHTVTCLILDNMEWLFKLKPSFVMILPSEKALDRDGSSTNTTIIYPKFAQKNMNFKILSRGSARVKSDFFGTAKEGRTFDFYYRFFETGFELTEFEGLENSDLKLKPKTKLEVSSSDYSHPSMITGNYGKESDFKVFARVKRIG